MSGFSADSPVQGSNSAKKRNRNPIWDSFTEVEENGEIKMQCSQCHDKFSKYKTVLVRHWEKKHQDKDQPRKKVRSAGTSESVEPKEKYKKVQKALSAVLSIPSLPIYIFMHPLIRKLFQVMSPSFELPKSFASFKRILQDQFLSSQESIKDQLSKMHQRFSLTCDVWTDSGMRNAYLGVTLHYTDVTGTLRRVFLGLQQLEDSHTGALIRRETEKILSNYGLSLTNAFKVVTDAGSNMVKAFTEIRMSDIDPNQYVDEEEQDEGLQEADANNEDQFQEVELLLRCAFPLRLGCFAHALQLVIMQIFKDCESANQGFRTMANLIGKFKKSHSATNTLSEACGKVLVSPSKTRWASQIAVLSRYTEIREEVAKISQDKNWEYPTESENEFLREIYSLTKIFADVLLRVQAEKNVTISKCYGFIKAIYRSLDKFEERVTSTIAEKLRALLHKRFDKMMDSDSFDFDPIFIVATALDPNTACFLTENDYNIAVNEIQNLVRYEQPQQQGFTSSKLQLNTTLDQLLGDLASENRVSRNQKTMVQADAKSWIREKLKCVINASSSGIDPLKWWVNMLGTDAKSLAILALEVFSIPATSAPIERIFSEAGLATAKHRNRTSLELLNSQIVVYCNMYLENV